MLDYTFITLVLRAFSHADLLHTNQLNQLISSSFCLDDLGSFKHWKASLVCSFESKILSLPSLISPLLKTYFHNLTLQPASIFFLHAPCKIVGFYWPNKELKILHLWLDDFILIDNTYWLSSYPFINRDTLSENSYTLSQEANKFTRFSLSHSSYSFTHNNHFGHFLVDDLPLISLRMDHMVLFLTFPVLLHLRVISNLVL